MGTAGWRNPKRCTSGSCCGGVPTGSVQHTPNTWIENLTLSLASSLLYYYWLRVGLYGNHVIYSHKDRQIFDIIMYLCLKFDFICFFFVCFVSFFTVVHFDDYN